MKKAKDLGTSEIRSCQKADHAAADCRLQLLSFLSMIVIIIFLSNFSLLELNRVFFTSKLFLPVNPLWTSRAHVNRPDLQYPVISRVEECIKAFKNQWFNKQYNLNAVKAGLAELFQWCCHHKAVIWGKLAVYEYVNDGDAVNSPLGLLYDNWRIPVNSPRRIRNNKARFLNSTNASKYHNGLDAQCWKVWNHSQSTPNYSYPSLSILAKKVV